MPLLLTLVALLASAGIVASFASELHALVTGWMPALQAGSWYTWLWIGPARLGLTLLGMLLFVVVAAVVVIGCLVISSLLASPFLDALSRRVEQIVAGVVSEVQGQGWLAPLREGGRAVVEEARRMTFFLAVQLALAGFGLLVPGGQLLAPPAMTLFTLLFLPLDYSSYTLDRRGLRFREKRRWILDRPALMLGFGGAAFLTCLVPLLNLLAMPVLVVAGTLLALRHAPAAGAAAIGSPDVAPGRSTSP